MSEVMSHDLLLSSSLEKCSYDVFLSFQRCLDTSDNWKLFIKSLDIINQKISLQEIHQLEIEATKVGGSPAKYIWLKLQSWLVTTQELIYVLRHCQLLDPLFFLAGPEPLEITTQPGDDEEDRFVAFGSKLMLTCEAKGLPAPRYQWFHNNEPLLNQNQTKLYKDNLNCEDNGAYYCQVSHILPNSKESSIFSHYVNVTVEPPVPQITSQSSELHAVQEGKSLLLRVFSSPPPEELDIKWYHNNTPLLDEHSSALFLDQVTPAQAGYYLCQLGRPRPPSCVSSRPPSCVSSRPPSCVFSRPMNLIVLPAPPSPPHETSTSTNRASCKLALLLANDTYTHLQNLQTPCRDIATIAAILESLDFVVFAVCNLTKDEMLRCVEQFCHIVPPKAYVFFYYVGHGFLMGDKYFMPVDCPENEFLRSDCVCDKQVMSALLHTDPQLIVFVLDMCLVRPDREINPNIYEEDLVYSEDCRLHSTSSIFEAFATRSQSYERLNQPLGIYAHHLVKFLSNKNLSVSKIFLEAHADLITHNLETNQRPLICVDAASNFKLSDSFLSAIHNKVLGLFSVFTTIKKPSIRVDMKSCGSKFTVNLAPHHCFLNVLSVTFDTPLPLECSTCDEDVKLEWIVKENEKQTLLIQNLQRVKTKLVLRMKTSLADGLAGAQSGEEVSHSSGHPLLCEEEIYLSLGQPLIVRSTTRPYTQSKWKNYQLAVSKPSTKS